MKKMIPDMAFVTDATALAMNPAMNIVVKRRNFPRSVIDQPIQPRRSRPPARLANCANKGATGGFSV